MRVLVTGATGFIGRALIDRLDEVVVLSRDAARARGELPDRVVGAWSWNPIGEAPPAEAFAGVEAVFHLAGEPIAEGRWTAARKARLRDSRVLGTRNLVDALVRLSAPPRVLISASAVGYYGDRGDEVLTEAAPPANDFLGGFCREWEQESRRAEGRGMRVVNPRIGLVLGPGGGALAKMLPIFRRGLGSPLGSGRQWMPWIHRDDLIDLLLFAAGAPALNGAVNATAPQPVTNREFTRSLARAVGRTAWLPAAPAFALRLALGELSSVLLASQRALPRAALDAGFSFRYPDLESVWPSILAAGASGS
jgi:hypothetical protein